MVASSDIGCNIEFRRTTTRDCPYEYFSSGKSNL